MENGFYEKALFQFRDEEQLGTKKDFDNNVAQYGYDYLKYYNKRYYESSIHVNSFDPESY